VDVRRTPQTACGTKEIRVEEQSASSLTPPSGSVDADRTADRTTVQSIGIEAGRGLRWSLLGNVVLKMGSFTLGLILARILTPADFGVYAVALAALNFLMHVNDVGIIAAAVQWRGRLEDMAPTGSTLAVVFSTGVYGVFWWLAPWFAELSGSPGATGAIRLLTVGILIDGVTAVRAGALIRRFQQDKLAKANLAGFVVNFALAITLALHGAGAYSFVGGYVAGAAVTGVLVFVQAALPVRLGLDRKVTADLMRFGIPLAAGLGVEAILLNADYVFVGRYLGVVAVGFYLLAFNISSWMQGLVGQAIRWVSIPSFSRLAEEDGAVDEGVRRSVPLLVSIMLPVATILATLAPPLVVGLYGERWAPAAAALPFLAVLAVIRLLHWFAIDILTSVGATRSALWINAGWAVVLIPALAWGTSADGIRGTAIAHALVGLLVALPLTVTMLRRAGVGLTGVLPALVRPLSAAAATAAACLLVVSVLDLPALLECAVGGTVGLGVYLAVLVPVRQLRSLPRRIRSGRPVTTASAS
jgi:O-antigen/teichoic acid export membrane protein